MSRNEWEQGTIKIPAAAWARFKSDLREQFNKLQAHDFAMATRVYEAMLALGKGKRNFDWSAALMTLLGQMAGSTYRTTDRLVYEFKQKAEYQLTDILLPQVDGKAKPRRPLKKDFPLANGKTVEFDAGDGAIYLLDEQKSVKWVVSENNHAVEHARNSEMGLALFKLLSQVAWTRGSGGEIVGNDEYNRESDFEGGGGNYVKETYGAKPQPGSTSRGRVGIAGQGRMYVVSSR